MGPVRTNSKYKKHYQREVNLLILGTAKLNMNLLSHIKFFQGGHIFHGHLEKNSSYSVL